MAECVEEIMLRELLVLAGYKPEDIQIAYDIPYDRAFVLLPDTEANVSGSMIRHSPLEVAALIKESKDKRHG